MLDRLVPAGVKVIEFMYEVPHALPTDEALIRRLRSLGEEGRDESWKLF